MDDFNSAPDAAEAPLATADQLSDILETAHQLTGQLNAGYRPPEGTTREYWPNTDSTTLKTRVTFSEGFFTESLTIGRLNGETTISSKHMIDGHQVDETLKIPAEGEPRFTRSLTPVTNDGVLSGVAAPTSMPGEVMKRRFEATDANNILARLNAQVESLQEPVVPRRHGLGARLGRLVGRR